MKTPMFHTLGLTYMRFQESQKVVGPDYHFIGVQTTPSNLAHKKHSKNLYVDLSSSLWMHVGTKLMGKHKEGIFYDVGKVM